MLVTVPSPAAAAPIGTFALTEAQLSGDGATRAVFPMTLSSGVGRVVRPAKITVARDGLQEQAAFDAVSVTWDQQTPGLVLSVARPGLLRAGKYEIVVKLSGANGDGRLTQIETVTLTRPSAPVVVPGTLTVRQTRNSWLPDGWDKLALVPPDQTPVLSITTAQDFVLSCVQARHSSSGAGSIAVHEACADDPVKGARTLTVPYEVGDDMPIGTSGHSVILTADEFTDSKSVAITVTSRRSPTYLTGLIVLGLLLGWIVRVGLVGYRRRLDQRLQLIDFAAFIEKLQSRSPSASYLDGLQNALDARPSERASATDFEKGMVKANDAADAAVAALDTAASDAASRIGALRRDVGGSWYADGADETDPNLLETVAALVAGLDRAETALADSDVDLAGDELAECRRQLPTVADAARGAVERIAGRGPELLAVVDGAWAAPTLVRLRQYGARLAELAPSTPRGGAGSPPIGDARRIERFRSELNEASWLRFQAGLSLRELVSDSSQAMAILERKRAVSRDVADAAKASGERLLGASWIEVPEALRDGLDTTVAAFSKARLDGAGAGAAALQDGRFCDAARSVISDEDRYGTRPTGVRPATDEERAALSAAITALPPVPQAQQALPPEMLLVPEHTVTAPRRSRAGTAFLSGLLGFVQFALLLPLVLLFGFYLFGDSWTGSVQDMLSVLTWAFGIDLTVAGVAAAVSAGRPLAQ